MDERTLEKNEAIQKMLKSEYDLAKRECEYYTQEFNKQDTIYGVYFAVFSVVVGAIYKIAETNNDQLQLANLAVVLNQKIIIGGMVLFLAFAYIYVFLVIMGNSYYLILYAVVFYSTLGIAILMTIASVVIAKCRIVMFYVDQTQMSALFTTTAQIVGGLYGLTLTASSRCWACENSFYI